MSNKNIFATPLEITDINACDFYHTMDIPGYGVVEGEWDLRKGINKYLGGLNFRGKRVLDVGKASGFISFYVEGQGAKEVISFDLDENHSWDVVPYGGLDNSETISSFKTHIKRLNNGFWFAHKALKSKCNLVYGSVYSIPEEIGTVDISIFGSILLHLENPFAAIQRALKLTKETVVIADIPPKTILRLPRINILPQFIKKRMKPYARFLPDVRSACHDTWWALSPEIIVRFIEVLGFEDTKIKYHLQKYRGRPAFVYTVVGHRTK